MYRFDPFFWGGGGFGILFMIACAIVFVLLIVWIVRRTEDDHHHVAPPHVGPPASGFGPYGSGGPTGWPGYGGPPSPGAGYVAPSPVVDPALQILRERFARGEITEAEFLSIGRTLAGPHP